MRKKYSKLIVKEFFHSMGRPSSFFGKSMLAKAAEYNLKREDGLQVFLLDGRIEINNTPAENAIGPNVIGRKNWMHSVSEAGAESNGIDFYEYLKKLLTDLPNLDIH